MSYKWRVRQCSDCGGEVKGYISPTKPVRCPECGIKALVAAARGMAEKSGPYYDRWAETAGPRGRPRKCSS